MKKWIVLSLFISLFSTNGLSWSNGTEFVGIVKNAEPEAFIIRNDVSEEAVVGKEIAMGDVLKTGADGSMGVIFKDDTIMAMGPKTEIVVQKFLFEPAEGSLSFIARMVTGTLSFISGQIAELAPDSVLLETPVATIGHRGTHFLVKIEKE